MLQTLPPPVHRRAAASRSVRQAVTLGIPLRRGIAVAAVAVTTTGGFLALSGASERGAPDQTEPVQLAAHPADVAAALAAPTTAPQTPVTTASAAPVVAPPPTSTTVPVVTAEESPSEERPAEERLRRAEQKREQAVARAKAAAERAEKEAAAAACEVDTSGLGAVKAPVRTAARFLGCRFDETEILGVAGRGGPSDHPRGLALDFMTDRVTGDAIAACALRNQDELGISYVIWEQQINTGSGWESMEDRGDVTANHFDHVHVSFTGKGGSATPTRC